MRTASPSTLVHHRFGRGSVVLLLPLIYTCIAKRGILRDILKVIRVIWRFWTRDGLKSSTFSNGTHTHTHTHTHIIYYFIYLFYFLWLCSPTRAMDSCGSAAPRGLWTPVALQPSAGYDLLWLCSPARAMTSCGSAAQRGLWPPVALQPSMGYGLLVHEVSWSNITTRHSR
jgi:hypothetical protein